MRFLYRSILLFFTIMLSLSVPYARSQNVEVDAASFRFDSTHAQVELYYGVLQGSLPYAVVPKGFAAVVNARAEVWQGGKAIVKQEIHDTERCECTQTELEARRANKLLAVAGFSVPYGPQTQAAFIWLSGTKADTLPIPLTLPDNDHTHFALSNIELGSAIENANGKTGPFEKAGFNFTPNPSGVFGENYSKLYYYTEVYVPQNLIGNAEPAEVVTTVLDPTGKAVLSNTQKVALKGSAMPVITAMDVDGLPDDAYKLDIKLKHEDAIVAEVAKTFYFSSGLKLSEEAPTEKAGANEDVLFATSDISKLTEGEADDRIAQSMYIGTESDRKTAKGLQSLEDKRHFLFKFWRKQDEMKSAKQPLDAYRTFVGKVDYVNKKYSFQKTIGWKSARGRVILEYGEPQYVKDEQFDAEAKPYIIWEYDPIKTLTLTTGTKPQFVFLDRQGGGNYVLVNSNVQGEVNDPNWYKNEALRLSH